MTNVCLFDIDGTLVRSSGAGKAAMVAALGTAFGVADPSGEVDFHGRTDRAIAKDLFRHNGVTDTVENWLHFRGEYLRQLPHHLASAAVAIVLPGIAALLEELAQREHCAVGLLTGNLADGARVKLGHFGLFHHFAFGGFGDFHFDRDSVAREAHQAAEQHLGNPVPAERVWVIGDTPLDIRCARHIGAHAIAVATGGYQLDELEGENPDLLLPDCSEFERLLELWDAS